ncbi:MAG: hypothetical protein HYW07_01645 [Candidatus Latescibacteria bacterium]|nr:hypothetical protein [Candidatus Latescibacterota bacterium]
MPNSTAKSRLELYEVLEVAVSSEVPGPWWRGFALVLGFAGAVIAIAYMGVNRPSARNSRQTQSSFLQSISGQGGFLICCLVPLLLSAVLLTTYWAWRQNLGFLPGARLAWGSAPITWQEVVLFGL